MEPTGVERREECPHSYFDGWMTFPQIADEDLSNDKGCGVMNWGKSGGVRDGMRNLIVGIVRGSWTKGRGDGRRCQKACELGRVESSFDKCRWGALQLGLGHFTLGHFARPVLELSRDHF